MKIVAQEKIQDDIVSFFLSCTLSLALSLCHTQTCTQVTIYIKCFYVIKGGTSGRQNRIVLPLQGKVRVHVRTASIQSSPIATWTIGRVEITGTAYLPGNKMSFSPDQYLL